ncbi:hypothetical protein D3C73_1506310 [compost metagenome]
MHLHLGRQRGQEGTGHLLFGHKVIVVIGSQLVQVTDVSQKLFCPRRELVFDVVEIIDGHIQLGISIVDDFGWVSGVPEP